MKYLLDTDSIAFFYDDQREPEHSQINQRISNLQEEDQLLLSVLSILELEYSCVNASDFKKESIRQTIEKSLNTFEIIPVQLNSAGIFG